MTEIVWWISRKGPTTGYGHETWDEDVPWVAEPGTAFWVRTMAVSGESVDSDWAHMNLVVPEELTVLKFDPRDGSYSAPIKGSANDQVGQAPNYEVAWFSADRRWMPHFAWSNIFLVIVPANPTVDDEDGYTLLYDISDGGSHQSTRRIQLDA